MARAKKKKSGVVWRFRVDFRFLYSVEKTMVEKAKMENEKVQGSNS